MGPKVAPKKSKAELKAEAEAQAARLAELEQQRIELERLGAEQRFAEQQHLRTTMLQEIEDELRQQHDAEQAASLVRDSECIRHREMHNEVDEWEAHLNRRSSCGSWEPFGGWQTSDKSSAPKIV